jgi:hypothetical protein
MGEIVRLQVWVWVGPDLDPCSFEPIVGSPANYQIGCPAGSELISTHGVGISVREEDGSYQSARDILDLTRSKCFGYDITDGWDPDNLLGSLRL